MIACWINHKDGYTLMDDSGSRVGVIKVMDNRILGRKLKGLYEPVTWFKMDGHRIKGKPPDKQIGA